MATVTGGPVLTSGFWDAFGTNWQENCLRWKRGLVGSAIPPSGDSWQKRWTANPAFHRRDDGTLLLYYRGNGEMPNRPGEWHDRLGVARVNEIGPATLNLTLLNDAPIADVGAPGSFNDSDVLDPTSVTWNGQVFVYYSAIGAGPDSIGAIASVDGTLGERFKDLGSLGPSRAPSALALDNHVYLLVQEWLPGDDTQKRYAFFLWRSDDGEHFTPVQETPIFTPTPGDWDGYSVVTGRLFAGTDGWSYLLYGGSASKSVSPAPATCLTGNDIPATPSSAQDHAVRRTAALSGSPPCAKRRTVGRYSTKGVPAPMPGTCNPKYVWPGSPAHSL